jgi:quercetin dioxygenase-like cupin family protein
MTAAVHRTTTEQGHRYEMPDGAYVVKASAEDTGGAFEVFEIDAPRLPPAPPHRAPWTSTMHLLAGKIRFHVEDDAFDLDPGETITVLAGDAFTLEVLSDRAHFLAVTSGDRASRFFADFADTVPTGRPMHEVYPQIFAVTQRHGVTILPGAS